MIAKQRREFGVWLMLTEAAERESIAAVLREGWLQPQREHHRHKAKRLLRTAARGKRMRLAMIIVLTMVAAAHALGVGHAKESAGRLGRLDLWVSFASIALPAWAAAIHVMLSLDDPERL